MSGARWSLVPLAFCLVSLVACKQAQEKPAAKPGAGPQVAATVVSIRTTAGEQATNHEIVIANGRARSTREHDLWRLYDTKADTVTFVDDVEKTFRTEKLSALLQQRRSTLAGALPPHVPQVRLVHGGTKQLLGRSAQQKVVQAGEYRRELWLASHPAIPEDLFTLMLASDRPSTPFAPMMRRVDEELLRARGFPLVDRIEVPLGKGTNVIERTVTAVASRQMPEAMLRVPSGYKDVTPKPEPEKSAQ